MDQLQELQKQIAEYESYKTDEDIASATVFFKACLHPDLIFQRADGKVISREKFLEGLKLPNRFVSRQIQDVVITSSADNQKKAWVSLVVLAKEEVLKDGEKQLNGRYFHNLRLFEQDDSQWKLCAWYNTEIEKGKERQLETTKLITIENPKDHEELLKWLYEEVCNNWRQFVEVRFKLLGLLPTVSVAALISLFSIEEIPIFGKVLLCLLGLFVSFALLIYDKRNSELHDDLVSRGRKIEEELGIKHGQFMGRLKSNNHLLGVKVQHDIGLNIIYYASLIIWLIAILFFFI